VSPAPSRAVILLFDIDGTLLLSGGAGRRAMNRLFEARYGVKNAFHGIRPHGMTDPAIFREIILNTLSRDPAPGELDALCNAYLDYLAQEIDGSKSFTIMPGVTDLLPRLSASDRLRLGLATGNLAFASRLKLRRAGLDRYFSFGGFGSDAEDRAELTRIARDRGRDQAGDPRAPVVVVGDTVQDVRAARAVGARSLAVMTTGTSRATFEIEGADLVTEDLADHEAILAFLGIDESDLGQAEGCWEEKKEKKKRKGG
jgi:phosphoglycolate phosphatase-like HAD superfamily hydrolase